MLDLLGIPYLKSRGEAEAFCALLNSVGMVHGVLTDDTDALLYGALTVYKSVATSGSKVRICLLLVLDCQVYAEHRSVRMFVTLYTFN